MENFKDMIVGTVACFIAGFFLAAMYYSFMFGWDLVASIFNN